MLFSVCNGSDKTFDWMKSNGIVILTSALLVRPMSLLVMNVFAPVVCLKFGECCCVKTTKKKSESEQIEMVPIKRGLPQNVCVAIEERP